MKQSPLVRTIALAAALVAPQSMHAQAWKTDRPALPADSLELGRKYTQWFLSTMADSMYAHMDSAGKASEGSVQALQGRLLNMVARIGAETEKMEEKWILRGKVTQYWYQAKFTNVPEPVVIRWVMNPKGELIGQGVNPLSRTPPADPKP